MTEFKTGKATVRIYGSVNREKLEESTIRFVKKAERQRKGKKNERL